MAYNTRTRDPLLEDKMQAALRRRFKELMGLALITAAMALAVSLYSYVPEDPTFYGTSSGPAQNILGLPGALAAGTMMLTIGWASWCVVLALIVVGFRYVTHNREHVVLWRAVFIPIFIATASIFLATNATPASWVHSWGLGGFTGDAALEFLLALNPISVELWVRILSISLGVLTVVLGLYSTGFSWSETKGLIRYSWKGILLAFALLKGLLGGVFRMGSRQVANAKTRRERKTEQEDGMPSLDVEGRIADAPESRSKIGRKTLFTALPVFSRKNQVEEESEISYLGVDENIESNSQRIKRRISDAIKKREGDDPGDTQTADVQDEPTIDVVQREEVAEKSTDDTGPQIEIADLAAKLDSMDAAGASSPEPAEQEARLEPPLTADHAAEGSNFNVFDDAEPELNLDAEQADAEEPSAGGPFKRFNSAVKSVIDHKPRATMTQSSQAKKEAQPNLFQDATADDFETPALSLLANPKNIVRQHLSDEALTANARMLENVLDDYGVKGEIVSVRPGPVVTMYELEPAPGLKASRVIGLSDDIARSMSALSARVSTVPGRTVIGIELPNENRETVLLREILSCRDYGDGSHGLPLALGKDIGGAPIVADLAKMPHLLIAGTTGSGKSVAINTMILSLLYKLSPDECRLIMVDPKMLELSVYDGIPHLLSPVVTDPKKAVVALKWVVAEMEERYRKMSKMGVRNIAGYNARVKDALANGEDFERTVQTGFDEETGEPIFETETFEPQKLPFIVVVVDEMADLMMVAGKEIEACIQRLAQMARASGIHLIMATQRPSVDVITGTIKANFPTRISFQVTSKVDSRTILGEMGAEQLLGMGDMLYMEGGGKITRVHAPFVSDEEVEVIVNHLKIYGPPKYVSGVVAGPSDESSASIDAVLGLGGNTDSENALYDQAVAIVAQDRKCSTSYIQRKLSIGYNKAAKLVEEMEENGIVSAANHVGKRDILLPEQ